MHRSGLTFALFFGVISLLLGSVHYYLWARLIRAPQLDPAWHRAGTLAFVGLAALTPAGLMIARLLPRKIATWVAGISFGWMGVAVVLFFLLAASDVVRLVAHGAVAIAGRPLDADRRLFLARGIAGSVGALALALAGSGTASALGEVALQRVRVALRRLPRGLSGFKIVQISDVHIGPTIGGEWLRGVVEKVNAQDPDLVVITGDLVDGSVADLRAEVAPLAALRAKHGVYFVTGNHEYYSGVDAWIEELGRLGVRTLRNERVSIGEGAESFDLAGVDDWSAHRFGGGHGADLGRALAGRDPERELVLLAHQPKQITAAAAAGVGLQLSGHTHGGQIFPWNYFVRLDQPCVAGLARLGEGQVYVSRGTGYWGPPMRIAAPSEISVIELVAEGAA